MQYLYRYLYRYLYNTLITLALPLALLRLLWRSRSNPAYRQRLGERFMTAPTIPPNAVWIHTVSVGEFLAVLPLIEQLLHKSHEGVELLITTTTPTGSAMVTEKLGERVAHVYLPFDAPFLVKRFLNHTRPSVAVFVETEIWANYLRELKQRDIPALLINARLSARSFAGYAKLGAFSREVIGDFTAVACQNEASCERFLALGAKATTLGNLKFDLQIADNLSQQQAHLQTFLAERAFILVASTHPGEEDLVLNAFQRYREQAEQTNKFEASKASRLLVIAPRHVERSGDIIALAESKGLSAARYSALTTPERQSLPSETDVLIVDVLGQLLPFYSLADYAIVGGSFVPHGGHNPLEAALFATPCLMGEHYFNFESLVQDMRKANAIEVIAPADLFVHEPSSALGNNAQQFLQKNQGATQHYLALIKQYRQHKQHGSRSS